MEIHDHTARLQQAREGMPSEERLFSLSHLFYLLSDGTRIRILYALSEAELCVCAIAELLNMSQSAISHQLRALREGNLVKSRRDGKTIYYSLADNHVRHMIDQGYAHINE